MAGVRYDPSLQELRRGDRQVEAWQAELLRSGERIDAAVLERLELTARTWASRLNDAPPPTLGPSALSEIRRIIIGGYERVLDADGRPLDVVDDLMIRAEAIRHVFRDSLDADVGVATGDAHVAMDMLDGWLPGVRGVELAELLDRSPRQVQRWRSTGGVAPRRLELVVRLVALLRHGWTPNGIIAWFRRPRAELGGAAPISLLDDEDAGHDLVEAARRGRAQHGS